MIQFEEHILQRGLVKNHPLGLVGYDDLVGWSLAFSWLFLNLFFQVRQEKSPVKNAAQLTRREQLSRIGLQVERTYSSPKQLFNAYLYPKNIMIQDESKIYTSPKTIFQILVNVAFSSDF